MSYFGSESLLKKFVNIECRYTESVKKSRPRQSWRHKHADTKVQIEVVD